MEFFFAIDMGLVCIDRVQIFDIKGGPATKKEFEVFNKFPTVDEDGKISVESDSFTLIYGEVSEDSKRKLRVKVPKLRLSIEASFPGDHESLYWS